MNSDLYILTGFTAVGKTRFSLDWAKMNDAEIISCDSLLFYRHMDVGTAKPSKAELREVPHHLIDVVAPSERYSVFRYVGAVKSAIADIHARGKRVLIVGGSGFYLRSFFSPVVDDVTIDSELESEIVQRFDGQSLSESVAALRDFNPDGLSELDLDNPRRVLKAWLRCAATGKSLRELREAFESKPGPFDSYCRKLLILSRPREVLEDRARRRVNMMISSGLIDEVRRLINMDFQRNPSAAGAIGYRETLAFIEGLTSEEELAEAIARNTRKLLKKQRTWFKKFLPIEAVFDVTGASGLPDDWYRFPC